MQTEPRAACRNRSEEGFTLIEMMVVVVVIGILVSIAIPNFASMTERTKAASCVSNQRNLVAHTSLYVADNGIFDLVVGVEVLFATGSLPGSLCECPTSTVDDRADYEIEIVDGVVVDVTCRLRGADHEWEL